MGSKQILIVDDSRTQLVSLQMAFEKEGFEVITASDGLEGVSRAFSEKPDLIISDIMMPELNGYQLCRLLKNDKKTAHIPIILLTSLDQRQDRFWGIRAGADQYIVKSSELSPLKEAVNQLLNKIVQPAGDRKINVTDSKKDADWKMIKSNVNRLLDKLLFESTLSNEARHLANFIYSRDDLLKELTVLANSLIDYSGLCICLLNANKTSLYFDLKQPLSPEEIEKVKNHLFAFSIKDSKEKDCETYFIRGSIGIDNKTINKIASQIIVPLNIYNECIGYLFFFAVMQNTFTQESENIIHLLAHDFSMVIKLMLLYDETKELSITDGLTGLYNKRYFLEVFDKEIERGRRSNSALSLIVMDIDHFKLINDTYGHLQGDSVLKEVASIIKENIRKIDFPARYGGEEFATILPNTNIENAVNIAEKIRKLMESHNFKAEKEPLKVTISMGVAKLSDNVNDKLELIKMADDALYDAKKSGRNRVCTAKI